MDLTYGNHFEDSVHEGDEALSHNLVRYSVPFSYDRQIYYKHILINVIVYFLIMLRLGVDLKCYGNHFADSICEGN